MILGLFSSFSLDLSYKEFQDLFLSPLLQYYLSLLSLLYNNLLFPCTVDLFCKYTKLS